MSVQVIGDKELLARIEALRSAGNDRKMMAALGAAVAERAKIKVPRKTGNLGRSIEVTQVTADRVQIVARGNYAAAVELGTKAHDIKPRFKKSLFFASQKAVTERFGSGAKLNFRLSGSLTRGSQRKYGNAAYVHAKVVHHPGTKAQPYMRPATDEVLRVSGIVPKSLDIRWNGAA